MFPTTLTFLVLAAIAVAWAVEALLILRQMRHVLAHRASVPTLFAGGFTRADHERAADYTAARARLALAETTASAALSALWVAGGLALAWQVAGAITHTLGLGPIARELCLVALMALVSGIVGLPFAWFSTFRVEARFGFNRMSAALFWSDVVKSTLLSVAILGPALALAFWLMRQAGPSWWLWAWGALVALELALVGLYPTVIAPLFNRFMPLDRPDVKAAIEQLLAKAGFSAHGLYVADGSRRSTHGNAYFAGLGHNRRIVFFDTLLERLSTEEILAVLAHELGHYRHRHIGKRLALLVLAGGVFLAAVAWVLPSPSLYTAVGIAPEEGRDAPGLALVILGTILPPLFFWLTPVVAWYSRRHEFEADRYAAELTSAKSLISALVKLYRDNASTLTPDPLYSAWYHSHPPAAIRIAHLTGALR
ncbi:MAG: M48 family metallopeptidase [Casimicrobiaceae bacterium]|nr:M48 family metallopeptidase [Casimicrobiaceae bacterium]MDW8312362.1 M48 family metallopeptidase [Burkholderiales bacterium]